MNMNMNINMNINMNMNEKKAYMKRRVVRRSVNEMK